MGYPPTEGEGTCIFDGSGISLIGDVDVLDRDRRALELAYAPEGSRSEEDGSEEDGSDVILGIFPCRLGRRGA